MGQSRWKPEEMNVASASLPRANHQAVNPTEGLENPGRTCVCGGAGVSQSSSGQRSLSEDIRAGKMKPPHGDLSRQGSSGNFPCPGTK